MKVINLYEVLATLPSDKEVQLEDDAYELFPIGGVLVEYDDVGEVKSIKLKL